MSIYVSKTALTEKSLFRKTIAISDIVSNKWVLANYIARENVTL